MLGILLIHCEIVPINIISVGTFIKRLNSIFEDFCFAGFRYFCCNKAAISLKICWFIVISSNLELANASEQIYNLLFPQFVHSIPNKTKCKYYECYLCLIRMNTSILYLNCLKMWFFIIKFVYSNCNVSLIK